MQLPLRVIVSVVWICDGHWRGVYGRYHVTWLAKQGARASEDFALHFVLT